MTFEHLDEHFNVDSKRCLLTTSKQVGFIELAGIDAEYPLLVIEKTFNIQEALLKSTTNIQDRLLRNEPFCRLLVYIHIHCSNSILQNKFL